MMLDYIIGTKGEEIFSSFTDNVKFINFIAWERKTKRKHVHHSRIMESSSFTDNGQFLNYRNETRGEQSIN